MDFLYRWWSLSWRWIRTGSVFWSVRPAPVSPLIRANTQKKPSWRHHRLNAALFIIDYYGVLTIMRNKRRKKIICLCLYKCGNWCVSGHVCHFYVISSLPCADFTSPTCDNITPTSANSYSSITNHNAPLACYKMSHLLHWIWCR